MRVLSLALVLGCGGASRPAPELVANKTPPAATVPVVSKTDALGTFTTRTRPQVAASGTGAVAGKLTFTTGDPMIGATVVFESAKLLGERVQITDEKGEFVLDGFPAGRYRITVYYSDQTVRRTFEIEVDRVTDLVLANWDETFRARPEPTVEPALPEPPAP